MLGMIEIVSVSLRFQHRTREEISREEWMVLAMIFSPSCHLVLLHCQVDYYSLLRTFHLPLQIERKFLGFRSYHACFDEDPYKATSNFDSALKLLFQNEHTLLPLYFSDLFISRSL